ncbi:MAG: hypothetical protein DRP60_02725, partial [Spirochaetes bacterium]
MGNPWKKTYLIPGGVFDSSSLKDEVHRLEEITSQSGFWDNHEKAENTMAAIKRVKARYEPWETLVAEL